MNCNFRKFEQVPLVSRKQAEEDALVKGLEGLAIGFAAGLVIGATIALLSAPKSGKDARQGICNAGHDVASKANCAADKVKHGATEIGDKVKSKFAKMKNNCCDDEASVCECCNSSEDEMEDVVEEILEEKEVPTEEKEAE